MSVDITDVWPSRGDAFIKVQGNVAFNTYPYESSAERTCQLERARRVAASRASDEFTDVVDKSHDPVVPAPPTASRRRRP